MNPHEKWSERDCQQPEMFSLHKGYASYAPVGVVSLEVAVDWIRQAIVYARSHGIKKLLIDARQLTGFLSPSLAERYWIVRDWAGSAAGLVAGAFILQPHLIDPERFGVVVAWNLGMRADVFTDVAQGLAWLLSDAAPTWLKS